MDDEEITQRPTRYYFAFTAKGHARLKPFLRKGFAHVFMFRDFENGAIFKLEPRSGYACYGVTDQWPLHEVIAKLKADGYRVVMITHVNDNKRITRRGFIITCASYLAYTIGIDFMGFTPYQLYKRLISKGGIEV